MTFFWGNKTLSYMRYLTLVSYRFYNPSDTVTLYTYPCTIKKQEWTESVQDQHIYTGPDYMEKLNDLGITVTVWEPPDIYTEQSFWPMMQPTTMGNFFKWWCLSTFGGWYSDMDILYTRPLITIPECDFALSCKPVLSIGLMYGRPNPFFTNLIDTIIQTYNESIFQGSGVIAIYALLYNANITQNVYHLDHLKQLSTKYPDIRFHNIPQEAYYYYSVHDGSIKNLYQVTDVPPDTYGIHWYGGYPQSQVLNNQVTEETIWTIDNTFCREARKCLE